MSRDATFMIESGKPLEMVKRHIAERTAAWQEVRALATELGVKEVHTDRRTGALTAVIFPDAVHPEFTKPHKRTGASYPKNGTSWAARLKAQKGYRNPSEWISSEFGIPLTLSYKTTDGWGSTCIGSPLQECGFLYLGEEGPYAMWAPDVPAIVAEYAARDGHTVDDPAASFRFNIDGARRIEKEEWEILVLQHSLAQRKMADAMRAERSKP